MNSKNEEVYTELEFVQNNSRSQQEKIKSFWKFLDAQNCLQSQEGISEHESPSDTKSSVSSIDEIMWEKDIWRKGLGVLQQLGLDKTALAADKRCKPCLVHKTIQLEDLADTWTQSYEELNTDMQTFDSRKRQESRVDKSN